MPRTEKMTACYCRLVEDAPALGKSIKNQKKELSAFAKSRKLAPEFFVDTDVKRTALFRMIEEIKMGKVKMVVVTNLQILGRRPAVFMQFLKLLRKHRVVFVSLAEGLDNLTPANRKKLKFSVGRLTY